MNFRTDLALEATENTKNLTDSDVLQYEKIYGGVTVTHLKILSRRAENALQKPAGNYITVDTPPLTDNEKERDAIIGVLAKELARFIPKEGTVLAVGLGNRAITPDALGPMAADMVLATRHIEKEFARSVGLEDLRAVAVLTPGVLGQTGTESGEVTAGICHIVHPAAIIAIDALAARSVHRLGTTIQISDTGIAPGAGVGNRRVPLTRDTLGIPIIAIGVPTVVDAATIAADCGADDETVRAIAPAAQNLVVTPREIDLLVQRAAYLIAGGINAALQPDFSPSELISLARG